MVLHHPSKASGLLCSTPPDSTRADDQAGAPDKEQDQRVIGAARVWEGTRRGTSSRRGTWLGLLRSERYSPDLVAVDLGEPQRPIRTNRNMIWSALRRRHIIRGDRAIDRHAPDDIGFKAGEPEGTVRPNCDAHRPGTRRQGVLGELSVRRDRARFYPPRLHRTRLRGPGPPLSVRQRSLA